MAQQVNIIPKAGEHCLTVGQNGSGKTFFNIWLLLRIPIAPIIIYDTKEEPKFSKLPASVVVDTMQEALEYKDNDTIDYIIVRPPVQYMLKPELLDAMLWQHYNECRGVPAYIDEAYTFHSNGKAGPGLTALLTRGRSRGISTIISTQRPVLLSRFCVTEAKKVYVFRLTDKSDKRRLDDVIPNYSDMDNPIKHGFYYYESGMDNPILFKPIKLDSMFDTGYSDNAQVNEGTSNKEDAPSAIKHIWI